jgi:hypothetical protein
MRLGQRYRFGMIKFLKQIETFADNLAGWAHNHTTHQWSGTHLTDAFARQFESAGHHAPISVGPGGF